MAGSYKEYINTLSEKEKLEFIAKVRELYLTENKSQKAISDLLQLDFNIIRGCIRNNEMKKSKELHYKLVTENSAKTNLERYGTKCTLNTENSIEKKKETWMKHYGVDNPSKSDVIKDKKINTAMEHYGVAYPVVLEEVKQKSKETCFKNFGVYSPLQSETVREKIVKTNLCKYGVTNTFQMESSRTKALEGIRENIPDSVRDILYDRDKFRDFLLSIPYEQRTFFNVCKKLNHFTVTVSRLYYKYGFEDVPIKYNRSHYETDIKDFIYSMDDTIQVMFNSRKLISPYELDLYIDKLKIGIEFNGDYWHSDCCKERKYHQNKSFYAKDKGIFVFNIWEHEWNDPRKNIIIKSQLRNLLGLSDKIYARNCEVREVSSSDSRNFLNLNHLQGNRNSSIRLGLYYNNELVSLMTFGKNKFIRKSSDDIELLRFCNKLNLTVVGGASKLFKYFLAHYTYDKIISYCDISKGTGKLYEVLGFKLDTITSPNYVWVKHGSYDVKSRYQTQMKNEDEIMRSADYLKVFDCGNYKYLYIR